MIISAGLLAVRHATEGSSGGARSTFMRWQLVTDDAIPRERIRRQAVASEGYLHDFLLSGQVGA